jgi:hypothetical protein
MESNLTECKECKQKKLRILVGKYPSKNKKYTDDTGKLWSGKLCPLCNHNRVLAAMRKARGTIIG